MSVRAMQAAEQFGGLSAPPAVKWLIDTEPELRERLGKYLFTHAGYDSIPVIVPAPVEEMLVHRQKRDNYKLRFPTILLKLRRIRHHLTNQIGVEVTCSDADLAILEQVVRETQKRKEIARMKTLV